MPESMGHSFSVQRLLQEQAVRTPDAIAIAAPGREPLTYNCLWSQIHSTVEKLKELGVDRKARVAIVLPNGPEMAVAFLSVSSAAVSAPLNPAYRTAEFEFYLSDLNVTAILLQSGVESPVTSVARERGIPLIELIPKVEEAAGVFALTGNKISHNMPEGFCDSNDLALLLHTSGTTSRPKIVPLTQGNMGCSARNIVESLQLRGNDCCLNVMPLFHIHGLIASVLSSLISGGTVVCTPGFYAPSFFEWMEAFRPTWYTAVPTMHQSILYRADSNRKIIEQNRLRFIRSSSSALPRKVMRELEAVFRAPVIEAYGMTEASHQITTNPLPPRLRKPGSVGLPAGVELAIMDQDGNLLSQGKGGEVVIRGSNVIEGYENNAAANTSAFQNGWLRTGDQGYLDSDSYLVLTGRLKEIINRAGEKISPGEIDEILMEHPAVAQVVTFAVPHQSLGEEIGAAIVLNKSRSATEKEIREFAAAKLADFKIPRHIVFLQEIPKGPTGKLQRIGLAERLGITAIPEPREMKNDFAVPESFLEKSVAKIWAEVLGLAEIGIHDDFFDLGGDSIMATLILSRIRDAMKAELSFIVFLETPTVEGMAKSIEKCQRNADQISPIQRVPREEEMPLSFAQQRLWFLDQLEPGNPAYNRPAIVCLSGNLDRHVLERSLNEIIRRHETLRTSFDSIDGLPVQRISPVGEVSLRFVDLQHSPNPEQELQSFIRIETSRPFDLKQASLFRAYLLRLAATDHVLFINFHHIIFDGWSMDVLFHEIRSLYEAFSNGKSSPLPELPIQYADFAVWQHYRLQGEELGKHLSYWKKKLAGAPSVLELPTDRPRPPIQTYRGANETMTISDSLADALRSLSHREGVTLFMTVLAAFKTLLYRYTGQTDILVGTPIAGRNRSEIEGLIGFFVNTLTLRTDLSGNPTFRELMSREREVAIQAYEHQDLPFEKLVEELRPQRDLSHSPIFQVLFNQVNLSAGPLSFPGFELSFLRTNNEFSQFDLTLRLLDEKETIKLELNYNTDLFDSSTIQRLLLHFVRLLEGIVDNPDERLAKLSVLADAEQHRLCVEWNNIATNFHKDYCIHQLFEDQVEKTPAAIAVTFQGQQLSYLELNKRSNQVAHHLQKLGVGAEVMVGLCVERSLEMVVALLGILKAGGAYVPLDPKYPKERLSYILNTTDPSVILTQKNLASNLPEHKAEILCLDSDSNLFANGMQQNPSSTTTSENLSYVMFTSGSTGRPKGVAVIHRNVVRLVKDTTYARFGSNEVFLQFAPLSFDASTFEIWGCLLNGGRLVVFPPHTPSLDELASFLRKEKISTLWLPAALFHQMVDSHPDSILGVGQLLAGGDVLSVSHVKKFLRQINDGRLINGYGPTENTTFTCCHTMGKDSQIDQTVPIGRPIANTKVYILDEHLQLAPIGAPGELFVGGDGLARGYLNNPELTAENFVPDPFSDKAGSRLYRTGDLVRYLPDGNIAFLGRIDDQVKIRGFRVEPGETETTISQFPGVRENVVVAWPSENGGEKLLVAYLVAENHINFTELRNFLKKKLPDHMIPSIFIPLDTLPLSENGKVDRRALPSPLTERPFEEKSYVMPSTPTEIMLTKIWTEVLGLERVGIEDNFFDLGGHSLLAIKIISRIRDSFKLELPLANLFDQPTVAGLAKSIEKALSSKQKQSAVAIQRVSRNQGLPLSFAQQRLWFFDQFQPGSPAYNIGQAIHLAGRLDQVALQESLRQIINRHEILRTTFMNIDGSPFQIVHNVVNATIQVEELSQLCVEEKEAEVKRFAIQEAHEPFDLAGGPLLRVKLLCLGPEEHVLLLTVHHIVFDGWSRGLFFRELETLYERLSCGNRNTLPGIPIQYADFAYWQRKWLQGEVLETQLSYWKEKLAGAPSILELPTDRPRPPIKTYRGANEKITISDPLADALKSLSRREGVTLFMTVLAVFKTLLYRYTGQPDVLVGTPIAGRNRSEIEGLIGFFVNSLALRTDLSGNPTFRELMSRVREVVLQAFEHQDLPFEKLVEELHPNRDLSHSPVFQVMFNEINFAEDPVKFPGLTLTPMKFDTESAKFDLTMYLVHEGDNLTINLNYNADLFHSATILQMLNHFQNLLLAVVAEADKPISSLSLLTEREAGELIADFNKELEEI